MAKKKATKKKTAKKKVAKKKTTKKRAAKKGAVKEKKEKATKKELALARKLLKQDKRRSEILDENPELEAALVQILDGSPVITGNDGPDPKKIVAPNC